MPVMSGLDALQRIMESCPLPVILFSTLAKEGADVTIKGLEYGALDFVTKPSGSGLNAKEAMGELKEKIKALYKVKVKDKLKIKKIIKHAKLSSAKRQINAIGMASSAGGVQASMQIVPKLPKHCPPMVWVQHMPEGFTLSFANRLNSISHIEVKEAKNLDKLRTGLCLLAPGNKHMAVKKIHKDYVVKLFDAEKVSGHKPSCDVLLDSVADVFTGNSLGIILTGMGRDGAKGISHMHRRGAFTIGQDESTCTVYSMPKVAKQLGGINIELPINEIINQIKLLI
jgi:two-component system chemotaxis response regulator CheB